MDEKKFKQALGSFASGITILTWREQEKIQGITVSAFSSLSLQPSLVLFCITKNAYIRPQLNLKKSLVINILAQGQTDLAYQFAGPNRDNLEALFQDENSFTYLKNAHCNLFVEIAEIIDGGDHDIFIAKVLGSKVNEQSEPLLYHRGKIF